MFTMKSGNDMQTLELIHTTEQQGHYAWLAAYESFLHHGCELLLLCFSHKYLIHSQTMTWSIGMNVTCTDKYKGGKRNC